MSVKKIIREIYLEYIKYIVANDVIANKRESVAVRSSIILLNSFKNNRFLFLRYILI